MDIVSVNGYNDVYSNAIGKRYSLLNKNLKSWEEKKIDQNNDTHIYTLVIIM